MKRIITLGILILSVFSLSAKTSDSCLPQKSNPPRLVNDFANVISSETERALEQQLVKFDDTTTIQIAIVTVNSLCGYDVADFAFNLGQNWGVGNAGFHNGLVIIVLPKTDKKKGEAFIATGYGLEAVLPDAISYRIVNNEMIPHFKDNDYDSGVISAAKIIMEITG